MSSTAPPVFIPDSIVGAPIKFPWKGANEHAGEGHRVDKLTKLLSGVTTCGEVSIASGILLWCAWRLNGLTEVDHNFALAQAGFAWQIDWRYVDRKAGPDERPPDKPPAKSAMMAVNLQFRRAINERWWDNWAQPIFENYHAAKIANHILPTGAEKQFSSWLQATAMRLKTVAPKPDEEYIEYDEFESDEAYNAWAAPHRGVPLPPQVIDPDYPYDPKNREALVAEFLESLDWKSNIYLRPPKTMLRLGFEGTPYKLS